MIDAFFDTSAVVKHYHREVGTAEVDRLLATPGSRQFLSRLTVVEFHSSLAKKARAGQVSAGVFHAAGLRLRGDLLAGRFVVVRVSVPHFLAAERLVRRISPTRNLRTLDALQLAVGLALNTPERPVTFITAAQALLAIAQSEGLAVINPELS